MTAFWILCSLEKVEPSKWKHTLDPARGFVKLTGVSLKQTASHASIQSDKATVKTSLNLLL